MLLKLNRSDLHSLLLLLLIVRDEMKELPIERLLRHHVNVLHNRLQMQYDRKVEHDYRLKVDTADKLLLLAVFDMCTMAAGSATAILTDNIKNQLHGS
jgi:hypothetical protein